MMNVGVKSLNHTAVSPVFLSWNISIKNQFLVWFLLLCVLLSAFSLVYIRDINRRLTDEWQSLQNTSQGLYTEWSQLLLERSTWATRARIEQIAKQQLGMIVPKCNTVLLINEKK